MIYSLLKPILFSVDAELAHEISLEMLNQFRALIPQTQVEKPVTVMGLDFPNPIGLAAGLDKNADYLPGLSKLGFGFIEVGTVTPKPQDGNPKPRLFRLPRHRSIINRMGFNNKGVDHLVKQVPAQPRPYILGINIGKNLSTAVDNALDDYRLAMQKVYLQIFEDQKFPNHQFALLCQESEWEYRVHFVLRQEFHPWLSHRVSLK